MAKNSKRTKTALKRTKNSKSSKKSTTAPHFTKTETVLKRSKKVKTLSNKAYVKQLLKTPTLPDHTPADTPAGKQRKPLGPRAQKNYDETMAQIDALLNDPDYMASAAKMFQDLGSSETTVNRRVQAVYSFLQSIDSPDFRGMSLSDFREIYLASDYRPFVEKYLKADLDKYNEQLKNLGFDSKTRAKMIGQKFFGSL